MRIDKFLWYVRYFKTRSISTDACAKNKVKINGLDAKASKEVIPGDSVSVRKDQIDYSFEILQIPQNRLGAKLVTLYIKDTTPKEEYEALELKKLTQSYYREKGVGRPTKKDRRDLDEFI